MKDFFCLFKHFFKPLKNTKIYVTLNYIFSYIEIQIINSQITYYIYAHYLSSRISALHTNLLKLLTEITIR